MKIRITYTKDETRRAEALRDCILKLLGKCRVHCSNNGTVFVFYLTSHTSAL